MLAQCGQYFRFTESWRKRFQYRPGFPACTSHKNGIFARKKISASRQAYPQLLWSTLWTSWNNISYTHDFKGKIPFDQNQGIAFQEISSISSSLISARMKLAVTDPRIKIPSKEINAVTMAVLLVPSLQRLCCLACVRRPARSLKHAKNHLD
jgi:hypothetical protein